MKLLLMLALLCGACTSIQEAERSKRFVEALDNCKTSENLRAARKMYEWCITDAAGRIEAYECAHKAVQFNCPPEKDKKVKKCIKHPKCPKCPAQVLGQGVRECEEECFDKTSDLTWRLGMNQTKLEKCEKARAVLYLWQSQRSPCQEPAAYEENLEMCRKRARGWRDYSDDCQEALNAERGSDDDY